MADTVLIKHFLVKSHYRTLNGLLRINHFETINPRFKRAKIPVARSGKISGHISLICFGHRLSTDDAILGLKWRHLRPLTLQEGLLFSFLHPDAQRHNAIVLAGTSVKDLSCLSTSVTLWWC